MAIDRALHRYTLGEELVNAITHGIGAVLAVIGTIILLTMAKGEPLLVTGVVVFGVTMVLMYTVSTVYHALGRNEGKVVLRILDHCCVFLLIIGTYAPYTLCVIGSAFGYVLFTINCVVGIIGIILTAIDMKKYAKFAMVCYIAMGWLIIIGFKTLLDSLSTLSFWLLIGGGIVYTLGAVVYGLGKKCRYVHSLWHFMVLAGNIMHYFSILYFIKGI